MILASCLLYFFVVSFLTFSGTNGQSQEWKTQHRGINTQDMGEHQQHWASGKAGNGGTQFMSMTSLYEKTTSLWEIDDLFIKNAVNIKDSFAGITATGPPDPAKEEAIIKACEDVDPELHQDWAMTVIDNVFASQQDLGLDASYPVLFPMLVPVRFLADKDMDITIEQIYSPPPTDQDSLNDGGSKIHQNTEKLHIHMGPKDSTVTPIDTQDSLYSGEEGFLFTGKMKMKRSTLCKLLCLRGVDNVPDCCKPDCEPPVKRDLDEEDFLRRSAEESPSTKKRKARSTGEREAGCEDRGIHYSHGDKMDFADCLDCFCNNGEADCTVVVNDDCPEILNEQHKRQAQLELIDSILSSGRTTRRTKQNLHRMKKYLTETSEEAALRRSAGESSSTKKRKTRSTGEREAGCEDRGISYNHGDKMYLADCLDCFCNNGEADCTVVVSDDCPEIIKGQHKRQAQLELIDSILSSGRTTQRTKQNLHRMKKYLTETSEDQEGRSERNVPPQGCLVDNIQYEEGAIIDVIDEADCVVCKCSDGEPKCSTRDCVSLKREEDKVISDVAQVKQLLTGRVFTEEQKEELKKIKEDLKIAQEETKAEELVILETLKQLFKDDKDGALKQGEFKARYAEQEKKARELFHKKDQITESFIDKIRGISK